MTSFSFRSFLLFSFVLLMSGCATYGANVGSGLQQFEQGNLAGAAASFEQTLSPTGQDRLLYHLELGVIRHRQQQYEVSNQLLTTAEKIAENQETISVTDTLKTLMSNPRQGTYGGSEFEKMFINYYKAMNYLGLAMQATTSAEFDNSLEGARIESRRLILRLNDLESRIGNYQEKNDKDRETFNKLLKLFSRLKGQLIDFDNIRYRDDALAHYLTGITFEMNGEYDDAIISYRKSAQAYEQGFTKQFRLDPAMTEQAWFDTIRMMRKDGGFNSEWRALASKKLSKQRRQELNQWDNTAQVIVVEHKGLMPQRQELNLEVAANPTLQALQIRPYLYSNNRAQLAWFYLLYADKSVIDAVANYLDATEAAFIFNSFTKTESLGPLWSTVVDLGLDQAIGTSMRITVPYYEPVKPLGTSQLTLNGKTQPLLKASNPALMAIQEQMLRSGTDIQLALARSSLKALTAASVANAGSNGNSGGFGGILSTIGKLTAQLTEAAETRSWLLLPQDIRIRRVPLSAGQHTLSLQSTLLPGQISQNRQTFDLQNGDIKLWQVRSLPGMQAPIQETPVKRLLQTSNQ